MLYIYNFQEYLANSRKFILQNKEFKFWHLQNLIKNTLKAFDDVKNKQQKCMK